MKSLLTPWRYSYLVQEKPAGCVFCLALSRQDDESSLIVHRGTRTFVILNLFPYANGHLMIVPNDHLASPAESEPAQRWEMIDLAAACEAALRDAYRADGVNLGMNLGKAAGAGIESHYHLHVVPRWEGDTNFMAVTADTRIIPEELQRTRQKVRDALARRLSRGGPPL
ncbi:MAG TPA: HIT domain-containing protein [Candidatus Polarisedimenticolia bacterium]|nr:HIT domain-containing protein [Candidatus Polarisedimenticolia bacterium]